MVGVDGLCSELAMTAVLAFRGVDSIYSAYYIEYLTPDNFNNNFKSVIKIFASIWYIRSQRIFQKAMAGLALL